jgi:hypothetical protein
MTRYAPLWLQSGSYAAGVDRRLVAALWPAARADGMAVSSAGAGMGLNVAAGSCAIPAANGTGAVLCASDGVEVVTLEPAPPSGTNRIDLVICQSRGADLDGGANNDFVFAYTKGTEAASPVAPATPPGALALAQVRVNGGAATIAAGDITDVRPSSLAVPGPIPARGYLVGVAGPATQTDVGATSTEVVSSTQNVVAGRLYRLDGYVNCSVLSAGGQIRVTFSPNGIGNPFVAATGSPTAANWIEVNSLTTYWRASVTGSQKFAIMASVTLGSLRFGANSAVLHVSEVPG